MNANKNQNKPAVSSLKGWLNICFGIIVAVLSLVASTGKTPIGAFIVYCLSFVFGMFYPFFLALIFFLGVHRIFARKSFTFKGHFMIILGFIFVLIASLGFASYSIYVMKDGGVDFTSLNTVYMDRMDSFAHCLWQIDSFEALSGLGGGYFGLFIITLLGNIWGGVGDAIFFSFLMILGLFFFMYHPILEVVHQISQARKNHVKYSSPYRPKKDKSNPHLNRDIAQKPAVEEKIIDEPKEVYATPSKNATAPLENSWSNIEQGSFEAHDFTPTITSVPQENETYEDNISSLNETETTPVSTKPIEKAPEADFIKVNSPLDDDFSVIQPKVSQPQTPIKEEVHVEEPPVVKKPIFQPQADFQPIKAKPVEETINPFKSAYSTYSESLDMKTSKQAEEFSQAQKVDTNTMPILEEVKNPLERVNSVTPIKNNQPAEFKVAGSTLEEPIKEEEPVKEKVLTEEEIEKQKEQEYFAYKQQKKAQELLAKKKEKDERISSLMKYVSDVPKTYSYDLPTDSLLQEFDDSAKMEKNTTSAQDKATIINRVFDEFGVKAKATTFTIGASVTRFNVETEHGEKADKIANLTSEFQRALNGDMSVRVETVVEGRSTSGIEVGNIAPMAVSFKDMFVSIEQDHKNLLLLPIGKDISGNIITFPLNKMPHMLVAGTTGSGKSVLIHSMIMTIIMRTYPSQCKLMLIDPKQVEFIRYQDCSHLFCPVISKPESAILALKKLCDEMDRRFTVLSKYRCANLEDYEELKKGNESRYEQMPFIVTIIDEFADLIQTGGNEVTKYVTRIAQKARACGIHLIIATQRPSKDNVPMIIKANVPCRIGLSCSSQIDSRVILDEVGAETLLGKGDLLFKCPGKKSLIRAQSPFISNSDIAAVLDYVKQKAGDPTYDPNFLDLEVKQEEEEVDVEGDLYSDVREFVIHTGITSKSSIMRNFQIASAKADQFLARLQSESVIILGVNGKYVLGPAAHLEDY